MIPLCKDLGVGCIPWSPLARGALGKPFVKQGSTEATGTSVRANSDVWSKAFYNTTNQCHEDIKEAVQTIADAKGVKNAHIALAWLLHKSQVTAPIIGPNRVEQLEDLVKVFKVKLTFEEIAQLEAPYKPQAVMGHT